MPVTPGPPPPLALGGVPAADSDLAPSTAPPEVGPWPPATTEARQRQLLAAGMTIASELSPPALLQRVVELAAQLTGAGHATLAVVGPDGALADLLTLGDPPRRGAADRPLPAAGPGQDLVGVAHRPRATSARRPRPARARSCLTAAVRTRGELIGTLVVAGKRGAPGFGPDDALALATFATQAGIAITNARQYEEARLRERWLAGVRETTAAILAGVATEDVLRLITGHARDLVEAEVATMVVRGPEGKGMRVAVAAGAGASEVEAGPVPWDPCLVDEVMRMRRPLRLRRVPASHLGGRAPSPGRLGGPALLVPFTAEGAVSGILGAANPSQRRSFGDHDARLLGSFADQAAFCLAYGPAQHELHRLTLSAGRQRIAEDVHDSVIQDLFAVGMGLHATATGLEGRVADRVWNALGELDRLIGELRAYISHLITPLPAATPPGERSGCQAAVVGGDGGVQSGGLVEALRHPVDDRPVEVGARRGVEGRVDGKPLVAPLDPGRGEAGDDHPGSDADHDLVVLPLLDVDADGGGDALRAQQLPAPLPGTDAVEADMHRVHGADGEPDGGRPPFEHRPEERVEVAAHPPGEGGGTILDVRRLHRGAGDRLGDAGVTAAVDPAVHDDAVLGAPGGRAAATPAVLVGAGGAGLRGAVALGAGKVARRRRRLLDVDGRSG
jgi:two-component system, NarL family, sensor histidine kinase DevS